MKVIFMTGYPGLSGKMSEIVYCRDKLTGCIYARRNIYPALTAENERIGSISEQIFRIQPSEDYKMDLRRYLDSYNSLRENRDKPVKSWSALYIRLMYEMARQDPEIDLRSINRTIVYSRDLPCKSLCRAIEAGLLPRVEHWEQYNREI